MQEKEHRQIILYTPLYSNNPGFLDFVLADF